MDGPLTSNLAKINNIIVKTNCGEEGIRTRDMEPGVHLSLSKSCKQATGTLYPPRSQPIPSFSTLLAEKHCRKNLREGEGDKASHYYNNYIEGNR